MRKVNLAELSARELRSTTSGEIYSWSTDLTGAVGAQDVFIHHEMIPPGRRASGPHRHGSEEMVFVIEGEPTAHYGSREQSLRAGDFALFPADADADHFIENRTEREVRLLVVLTRRPL